MGQIPSAPRGGPYLLYLTNASPAKEENEKSHRRSRMPKNLGPELRSLTIDFLKDINYKKPPPVQNDLLWKTMLERAQATGVDLTTAHSRRCFEVGFTYAAVRPGFSETHRMKRRKTDFTCRYVILLYLSEHKCTLACILGSALRLMICP